MKILFFVDVHESNAALNKLKEKAKKADLIICAGDISIFERGLKGLLEKINSFGKETLIINGNHEEAKVMAKLCVNYDNITFIHKKIIQRAEFTILGYGGGGFSQVDHEFDRFASEHSKDLANKKIIFVSHGPPYGTALDKLGKEHYGNKNYRRFIDHYKPIIAVSGHFHENAGAKEKTKNTLIINPGPLGIILEITKSV